ncbi:MAG: hypothetical protein ACI4R9_07600 [Kiritimatiellia bacterium]
MNADLRKTLDELGPGYRALVMRMTAAFDHPADVAVGGILPRPFAWRRVALVAATLAVCLGGVWALVFGPKGESAAPVRRSAYVLAYSRDAATVEAIVSSQRADGSWDNDFLTRQNAAALRMAAGTASRIAYRRAVRYLRSKGLAPLSDDELRVRSLAAARRFTKG